MRIIAGALRGRQLKAPTWDGIRPTSDRLRETLFNILGPSIRDARVLDGYAGTGAIGVEAISRGAAHVTFVDADTRATRLIAENLERLAIVPRDRYVIIRADLADAARRPGEPFDLVILDPPYTADSVERALDAAAPVIGPGTRVVIEHARRSPAADVHAGVVLRRRVVAGDSALAFYEREG
jgi:16S rRNA (guanine966-N2)-methyltransferase